VQVDRILLDDRTISEFLSHFEDDIRELIQHIKKCEDIFESCFINSSGRSKKWVKEYLFLSIESTVSSIRLLSEGHINAAGNTMRISYESLCVSMLLTSPELITVGRGKNKKEIDFNLAFENGENIAKPHLAINTVVKNSDVLGLKEGENWLREAKNFYNGYSHASMMVFSSIVLESGKSIVGGGFNKEKLNIYAEHLKFIKRLLVHLPEIIEEIANRNLTRLGN